MQLTLSSAFYEYLCYGFLYFTVISLWLPRIYQRQSWPFFFMISLLFGLISHTIEWIALIPISLLAIAVSGFINTKNALLHTIAGLLIILISIGLAMHLFPGFHNLMVIDHVLINQDAIPYSMGLNFDKTVVGIFILGILTQRITTFQEWLAVIKHIKLSTPFIILGLIVIALLMRFVYFEPKISNYLPLWCLTNLLFVCTAEEAFFRGFIQKQLTAATTRFKNGHYYAILVASILFGLAHYAGGIKYVILATIAGIGYGWVYDRTKRIEASIITHFGLNLTHFIFFTYPMLVSATSG
ncbi:MAG: CPBP family intramembrane metalloprotease [Gammaproteobacteria bacterium]|nr:CPBP family intramembrane metalloprotease [Gammaproteobacteria bacterium]